MTKGESLEIACLDLEGVLIPEVWINVAERTSIDALRLTTRDISDYDELMTHRLKVLDEHGLTLHDIQSVIDEMQPLAGANLILGLAAAAFPGGDSLRYLLRVCRAVYAQVGLADFVLPQTRGERRRQDYRLQAPHAGPKRECVEAFRSVKFGTIAAGDSYNDITMLKAADSGILFRPPQNVVDEFPEFPVTTRYDELAAAFMKASPHVKSLLEPAEPTDIAPKAKTAAFLVASSWFELPLLLCCFSAFRLTTVSERPVGLRRS